MYAYKFIIYSRIFKINKKKIIYLFSFEIGIQYKYKLIESRHKLIRTTNLKYQRIIKKKLYCKIEVTAIARIE